MSSKIGRKSTPNSNSSLIVEALKLDTVKNAADVLAHVKGKKPEIDDKKVAIQISAIVSLIKKQKDRWAKYTFDEESYSITEKTE